MKQVLNQVALLKKVDATVQVCVFIILLCACWIHVQYLVYYMLTMATLHVISCLGWSLFFTSDTPRFEGGTLIRRAFLVILALAGILLVASPDFFFVFAMAMLYVGPACGLIYFAVTLFEIRFYSKARKPYYLL